MSSVKRRKMRGDGKGENGKGHRDRVSANQSDSGADKLQPPRTSPREEPAAQDITALIKKASEYDELLDISQRLKAEYSNYQKRVEREQLEYRQECARSIIAKILPVLDNLERAVEAANRHENSQDVLAGLELVRKQFLDVLASEKVEPFESEGQKFDPRLHEAVMTQERDDVPVRTVLSQVQRGYLIGDRVLRAAKVVVSRESPPREPHGGRTDILEP